MPQSSRREIGTGGKLAYARRTIVYPDAYGAERDYVLGTGCRHYALLRPCALQDRRLTLETLVWLDAMTEPVLVHHLASDMCSALNYLSSNLKIVHGSLDPGCVAVCPSPVTHKLFLRTMEKIPLNVYRAPEQCQPNGYVSHATDVWSLACLTGELLLGAPLLSDSECALKLYAKQIVMCGLPPGGPAQNMVNIESTVADRFKRFPAWVRFFLNSLQISPNRRPPAQTLVELIPREDARPTEEWQPERSRCHPQPACQPHALPPP